MARPSRSDFTNHRDYMRAYMRAVRAGVPRKTTPIARVERMRARAKAIELSYESPAARIMGDPPIGRSALDQKLEG